MLRADLQKDLGWCKEQLMRCARLQEGETSAEKPQELFERVDFDTQRLKTLMLAINEANLNYRLSDNRSLTDLLAERDVLRGKHGILSVAYNHATEREERYGRSEIRWVASFNVVELRKKLEEIARQIRELNIRIQKSDWEVEVKL